MLMSFMYYTENDQVLHFPGLAFSVAPHKQVISELRDVTYHMGSHSVTCHPTQVNAPRLTSSRQAGARLTYRRGMEG